MAYKRLSRSCVILPSMTANLKQRQRKRPTQSKRTERGSVTRSNVAHPPAGRRPTRSTTRSVLDCGGNLPRRSAAKAGAQRRHRFRPHRAYPNHHETPPAPFVFLLAGRASASSFVILLAGCFIMGDIVTSPSRSDTGN